MILCRMYALLLPTNAFHLPNNPGPATDYTRADPNNRTPLTRLEQALVDVVFACQKHFFKSLLNIKRACFTALDENIDNAFKVSNVPAIIGWHAGMAARY
jgi:hypothetical protein